MKAKIFFMEILSSIAFLISLILLIIIKDQLSYRIINIFLVVCTSALLVSVIFYRYIIKEIRLFFNLLSLILIVLFATLVLMNYNYETLDVILIIIITVSLLGTLIGTKTIEPNEIKKLRLVDGYRENHFTKKIRKIDSLLENKIIDDNEHQKMRKSVIDKYIK